MDIHLPQQAMNSCAKLKKRNFSKRKLNPRFNLETQQSIPPSAQDSDKIISVNFELHL